jgi:hypothetical protein
VEEFYPDWRYQQLQGEYHPRYIEQAQPRYIELQQPQQPRRAARVSFIDQPAPPRYERDQYNMQAARDRGILRSQQQSLRNQQQQQSLRHPANPHPYDTVFDEVGSGPVYPRI